MLFYTIVGIIPDQFRDLSYSFLQLHSTPLQATTEVYQYYFQNVTIVNTTVVNLVHFCIFGIVSSEYIPRSGIAESKCKYPTSWNVVLLFGVTSIPPESLYQFTFPTTTSANACFPSLPRRMCYTFVFLSV